MSKVISKAGLDIPKDEFMKWIEALYSNKYKQSIGVLQKGDAFCCLGVACKVIVPEEKLRLNSEGFLIGLLPSACIMELFHWLKEIESNFSTLIYRAGGKTSAAVSTMNDVYKMTFEEIADVLYAVYILNVLD